MPCYTKVHIPAECLSDDAEAFADRVDLVPHSGSSLSLFKTSMKASTDSARNPQRFGCWQQIAAHVGGMTRAFVRHYPVNWTFHWSGICRAVSSEWPLARKSIRGHACSLWLEARCGIAPKR